MLRRCQKCGRKGRREAIMFTVWSCPDPMACDRKARYRRGAGGTHDHAAWMCGDCRQVQLFPYVASGR